MKDNLITMLMTIVSILILQLLAFTWYGKTVYEHKASWSPDGNVVFSAKQKYTLEGVFKLSTDEKYLYISEIELENKNGILIARPICSNFDEVKLAIRWDMENNRVYYTENEYIDITTGKFTCP